MNLVPIPPGKELANGHVYKVHFMAEAERASDREIATALAPLGVLKVEHAADGGTNVVITPNNTKENA